MKFSNCKSYLEYVTILMLFLNPLSSCFLIYCFISVELNYCVLVAVRCINLYWAKLNDTDNFRYLFKSLAKLGRAAEILPGAAEILKVIKNT